MQGSAIFEGSTPVMTAAEVARQGYAALKAGRPQIITGLLNKITAISTRFTVVCARGRRRCQLTRRL
jgi:hypothetical protein